MAFYIGQEVECIDPSLWESHGLSLHSKHIILNVVIWNGNEALFVSSVKHVGVYIKEPLPAYAYRFRALTKSNTDISIFTAMLGPKLKETSNA